MLDIGFLDEGRFPDDLGYGAQGWMDSAMADVSLEFDDMGEEDVSASTPVVGDVSEDGGWDEVVAPSGNATTAELEENLEKARKAIVTLEKRQKGYTTSAVKSSKEIMKLGSRLRKNGLRRSLLTATNLELSAELGRAKMDMKASERRERDILVEKNRCDKEARCATAEKRDQVRARHGAEEDLQMAQEVIKGLKVERRDLEEQCEMSRDILSCFKGRATGFMDKARGFTAAARDS